MDDESEVIPAPKPPRRPGSETRGLSPRGRNTRCSFCDKPLSAARAMVKSQAAHICDECIVSFRALVTRDTPPG